MAGKRYTIENTSDTVYLDRSNKAIKGYIVVVNLLDYNELHEVNVPSLDKDTVQKAVEKLIKDRESLNALGE